MRLRADGLSVDVVARILRCSAYDAAEFLAGRDLPSGRVEKSTYDRRPDDDIEHQTTRGDRH